MKIIFGIFAAVWLFLNVVNAGQSQATVIQVMPGDTLWRIAAEHSTARQDIRDVVATIRHLNKLDHNGQIYPGQMLKVPVDNK
jgi:LysM repeat protein